MPACEVERAQDGPKAEKRALTCQFKEESITACCAGVQEGRGVSRPKEEKQGQLRSRMISEAVCVSLPRAML